MQRLERITIAATLGGVPPIIGLLVGWWGAIPFLTESWIWLPALLGLLTGVLVDILRLRHWTRSAADLDWWIWSLVYAFYSVGIYGFFMGVPVFNAALAVPAGIVIGCRLARAECDRVATARLTRRACWLTTGVLAFFCTASAVLALTDPYTAESLEGLLALPFAVTPAMIVGLIFVGGSGLLVAHWHVTALTIRWARARARA